LTMTRSRLAHTSLLMAVLLVSSALAADPDFFETLDTNHDGLLDRDEYRLGLEKLSAFLQQPIVHASSSSWGFSSVSLDGFWKAFTSAVAMIIATEIGDKTFFIAAVLSMKHARSAVFAGAILALIVMTILSTAMGLVLPRFLPKQYTHWLSGVLFLYFGFKLLNEGRQMEAGRASDELEEVEEELLHKSSKKDDVEEGGPKLMHKSSVIKTWEQVILQSLTLTFLAEWGDRSQIATIALAASKNPIGVTVGGCLGHSLCTGLAVVGGRMLAARISERTVSLGGGAIFCVFGIHSLFFET
jgi:Ca2+/H+ antiporter, TMEM165/GDT1 family